MALMETFQDDFEFGGIDSGKWTNFGGSQVVIGTNLDCEMTSALGGNYIGINSLTTYNLTGSYMFSQLLDAGNQAITSWEVYPVYLYADANNKVYIRITGNQVSCWKVVATVTTQIGVNLAYNSTTMKWFKIKESGGNTSFQYASDPTSTWTDIVTAVANPITVTALTAELLCGTWQAEGSTTTGKFDNVNVTSGQYQFSWSNRTWNKRIHQANVAGQVWGPSNISSPDANGYITLSLTNAGSAPIGCEIFSAQRGFGYGTYLMTVATRLDTMYNAIGFGGMFTFDFTSPPDYKEIDCNETRDFGQTTTKNILHSHVYNNSGSGTFITDSANYTSDVIQSHRMIWEPNRLIFDAFVGDGVSGASLFHTEHYTNLPTPGLERIHFNIFVDTSITGYASATPIDVIIRHFTFDKFSVPGNILRHLSVGDGMSRSEGLT